MIFFLFLPYLARSAPLSQVSISMENSTITSTTTYQVNLKLITAISETGYILITFPSIYTELIQGSYNCFFDSSSSKKCTCELNSLTMSISSCFPMSIESTFNLKIQKIKNPSIAKTSPPFIINTYVKADTLGDTHSSLTLKFTEATLSKAKILNSGRVAELSTWTLDLIISLKIPSAGFIFLETPSWTANLGTSKSGSSNGKYCTGSITCKEISSLNIFLPCECSTSGVNVTVTQDLQGSVQLQIFSLTNPPSAANVSGFVIKTGLSDGLYEKSENLVVLVTSPSLLKVNRFSLSSLEVSKNSSYYFEIFTLSPIPQFSFIYLNFSSEFQVSSSLTISEVFGIYNSKVSVVNGKVRIDNGFNSEYLLENSTIAFYLNFIRNPESSKESESISVSVFERNSALMAWALTGLTVSAVPGSLKVNIEPSSWKVSETSIFTFTLTLTHSINQGGAISLIFPDEIIPSNSDGKCLYIPDNSALDKSANCKVSQNKYLIVTDGFPSGNKTNTIIFQISNVNNSKSTSTTSNFTISTCSTSSCLYFIDRDNNFSMKFLPNSITSVFIDPSVKTTGVLTGLVFIVEVVSVIPQKSYIEVEFPESLKVDIKKCSGISGVGSDISCKYDGLLNITGGFETGDFSGKFSFLVTSVTNPPSTRPVSLIKFSIKSKGNLILYKNDCFFQASEPHQLKSISIQSVNYTVGSTSDIYLNLEVFNQVPASWILLKENTEIKLKNSVCSGSGVTKCLTTNTGLNITLDGQLRLSISLTLSNIEMPTSTKPTTSLEIFTYESIYQVDYQNTSISLQMLTPNSLLSVSISSSNPYINEISDFSFSIKNKNPIPSSGFVLILFPEEISFIDPTSCLFSQKTTTCSRSSEGVKIKVLNDIFSSFFSVSVKNLKNPSKAGSSSSFKITTLTEDSYLIDQLTGLLTSFTCASLCETCENTASNCTSCKNSYYYNNSCHSSCLQGFYSSGSFECLKCDDLCLTCQSFEACTSCLGFKVLNNGKCLDVCPDGYFNNSFICEKCDDLCLRCAATGCLQCTSGYFLYRGTCVTQCPGFINGDYCQDCSTGCRKCENLNSCLDCITGYIFYENSCVSSCPQGTFEVYNSSSFESFCQDCEANCLICSGQNSCQECSGSFVLHEGKCSSNCPPTYFTSNKTCEICPSNCLTCDSSNCSECLPNFFFYNGQCLKSCPSHITVSISGKCQECLETCLTCSVSQHSCTSCLSPLSLYDSTCLSSCPSPLISFNSRCVECSGCQSCEGSPSNCSSCDSSLFLHEGTCLEACPLNISVPVGRLCEKCSEPCLFCQNQSNFCTQCKTGFQYQGSCLETCPSGYFEVSGKCESQCASQCSAEKLNNQVCDDECNVAACNYDNFTCSISSRYSSSLDVKSTPFPSTIASVSTTGVSGISKYFVPATSFVSSSVSLMSISESASWVNLAYQISLVDYTHGRELLNSKQKTRLALALVVSFLVIHFLMNLIFVLVYYFQILRKDEKLKIWSKSHKFSNGIIVTLSCLVSFKFMKIVVSNMFGFRVCKADLDKKSTLLKPMLIMSYISITTTSVPILCILVYILSIYSSGNPVFIFALDTLITTMICTLMMIPDIVYLHKEINGENGLAVMPEFLTTFEPDGNKNLKIETFNVYEVQDNDRTCMDTGRTLINPVMETRGNELGDRVENSCQTSEEIFFAAFRVNLPEKTEDVSSEIEKIEEKLPETNNLDEKLTETNNYDEKLPETKNYDENFLKVTNHEEKLLEINNHEEKLPETSNHEENPRELKNQDENHPEVTQELIGFEEVLSSQVSRLRPETLNLSFQRVSYDSILPTLKEIRMNETITLSFERVSHDSVSPTIKQEILTIESVNNFEILPFRPTIIEDESQDLEVFDSSKEFIDDENEPQLLETINEEDEIDLSNAQVDTFDMECIKVPHRASGLIVLVKKNFLNAIGEDGVQVNDKNYSVEEIDQGDVRLGVLKRSNSDSFFKARRHFRGSTIVDVELRSGIWLVGRTVRSENDFAFDNARLCLGGRSVLVEHVLSGIPYLVTKSFVGAVNEDGEKLEYDPENLVVNEQDPHLACFEGVVFRRSFVGGLVSAVLDEEDFEPFVPDSRTSDKTAFFEKRSSQSEFSAPADNSEFMSTFSDGFFVNKPSASIEIQTEEDFLHSSSLSLSKIDSISVTPLKIKKIQSVLQVDDPVSSQRKFKRFSKISEVNDSVTSKKSSSKSKGTRLKKRPKKQSKTNQSKSSSKQNTPRHTLRKSQKSASSNSNDSRSSLEAIYLQRLRTPKDRGEKFPKSSSKSFHEDSNFSLSIQQSLNQLHSQAAPLKPLQPWGTSDHFHPDDSELPLKSK